MKSRQVFGSSLRSDSQAIEVYERIHTGLGDGIMLRAAIVGNMKRHPTRRHILHIWKGVACIFSDIARLEIVPIIHPEYIKEEKAQTSFRYTYSELLISRYRNVANVYELSTPCADYETANKPYNSVDKHYKRLVIKKDYFQTGFPRLHIKHGTKQMAVATGNRIDKSRQQIFCDVVGVEFSMDNYNVKFTEKEMSVASRVLKGKGYTVGVQMRSSTQSRDYKRMVELVEYIAGKVDTVITFDQSWKYTGKKKNIISSTHGVREKWAITSLLDMFIGPDSFGVHAAGSVGVPTYGIFGPTDPECRLADYKNAAWSPKWKLPTFRGGLKLGCGRQYCWYSSCKFRGCINARSPKFYWNDAIEKLKPGE